MRTTTSFDGSAIWPARRRRNVHIPEIVQDHRDAQPLRQAGDGVVQLAVFRPLRRGGGGKGRVLLLGGGEAVVHGAERAPPQLAAVDVHADARDPRGERARRIVPGEGAHGPQPRLLVQVVRVRAGGAERAAQPVQPLAVPLDIGIDHIHALCPPLLRHTRRRAGRFIRRQKFFGKRPARQPRARTDGEIVPGRRMAAPPTHAPALSMAVGCGVSERASRAPARTGILYHTGDGAGRVDRCAGGRYCLKKAPGGGIHRGNGLRIHPRQQQRPKGGQAADRPAGEVCSGEKHLHGQAVRQGL